MKAIVNSKYFENKLIKAINTDKEFIECAFDFDKFILNGVNINVHNTSFDSYFTFLLNVSTLIAIYKYLKGHEEQPMEVRIDEDGEMHFTLTKVFK